MSYHRACCCKEPETGCVGIIPPKFIYRTLSGGAEETWRYSNHDSDTKVWWYTTGTTYSKLARDGTNMKLERISEGIWKITNPSAVITFSVNELPLEAPNRPCNIVSNLTGLGSANYIDENNNRIRIDGTVESDIIWTVRGCCKDFEGAIKKVYRWNWNNTLVNAIKADGCVFPYRINMSPYNSFPPFADCNTTSYRVVLYEIGCPEQLIGTKVTCSNDETKSYPYNTCGSFGRANYIQATSCDDNETTIFANDAGIAFTWPEVRRLEDNKIYKISQYIGSVIPCVPLFGTATNSSCCDTENETSPHDYSYCNFESNVTVADSAIPHLYIYMPSGMYRCTYSYNDIQGIHTFYHNGGTVHTDVYVYINCSSYSRSVYINPLFRSVTVPAHSAYAFINNTHGPLSGTFTVDDVSTFNGQTGGFAIGTFDCDVANWNWGSQDPPVGLVSWMRFVFSVPVPVAAPPANPIMLRIIKDGWFYNWNNICANQNVVTDLQQTINVDYLAGYRITNMGTFMVNGYGAFPIQVCGDPTVYLYSIGPGYWISKETQGISAVSDAIRQFSSPPSTGLTCMATYPQACNQPCDANGSRTVTKVIL